MATINFECHGDSKTGKGGSSGTTVTGVNSAGITGYSNDRVITVTLALSGTLGVPPGVYMQSGTDASGNRTYRQVNER